MDKKLLLRPLLSFVLTFASGMGLHAQTSASEVQLSRDMVANKGDELTGKRYNTGRGLYDYAQILISEGMDILNSPFVLDVRKANSWLDIGAGGMNAQLDWLLAPSFGGVDFLPMWRVSLTSDYLKTLIQQKKQSQDSRVAVGISVENAMPETLKNALAAEGYSSATYLTGKYLEDYTDSELGKFDLVTDVYGAVSYAPQIDLIFLKAIEHLKIGGRFYTHIQYQDSQRTRDGGWNFKLENESVDQVKSVKRWLEKGECISSFIQLNDSTVKPHITIKIEKKCDAVVIPALELIQFKNASPPTRVYRING